MSRSRVACSVPSTNGAARIPMSKRCASTAASCRWICRVRFTKTRAVSGSSRNRWRDKLNDLPIWELEQRIVAALGENPRLIVHAPTGSGKSTQVPQMLLEHALLGEGEVV